LAACLAPLGVRVLFRDRVPGLAALTYATPVCLLAAAATAAFALAWLSGRRGMARGAGCLALGLAVWTVTANVSVHAASQTGRYRGLLWNIANGTHGWDRVADHVRRHDVDIAAFIEVGANPVTRAVVLSRALPGRHLYWWNDVLGLAVRGRILDTSYHSLGPGSHAGVAHVELEDGRALTVVVVHPRSTPTAPRGEVFAALEQVLAPLRDEPLLVMGDFNTPSDSVFFDPLRSELQSAFETAGTGYAATWPMPFPVLALDQVWSSDSVLVRSCHLAGSRASDHRLVAFSFD
jgi:endonuclease/exonuclease/phosphatase (EEP) superfamily protein YafD